MLTYDKITDHGDKAVDRLTGQYQDAVKLKNIVRLHAESMQDIEDVLYDFMNSHWLETAEGVQLDKIGLIVGEPRLSRNDEDYINAILLRINLNRTGGQPEKIYDLFRNLFRPDVILYREVYPASIEIFIKTDSINYEVIRSLKKLLPAAIGYVYLISIEQETPFGFKELNFTLNFNISGFGELNETPLTGGALSELTTI